MVLVGADEQRRGEGVEAVRSGTLGGGIQTHFVALDAAVGNVLGHGAHKGAQGVFVALEQRQLHAYRVFAQAVAACAVLGEGMDIRVVPEARQAVAVAAQHVDALVGAGRTADMQKNVQIRDPLFR